MLLWYRSIYTESEDLLSIIKEIFGLVDLGCQIGRSTAIGMIEQHYLLMSILYLQ